MTKKQAKAIEAAWSVVYRYCIDSEMDDAMQTALTALHQRLRELDEDKASRMMRAVLDREDWVEP